MIEVFLQIISAEIDPAAALLVKSADRIHESCLSRSRASDDCHKIIAFNFQINVLKEFLLAVVDAFIQILHHQMHTFHTGKIIQHALAVNHLIIYNLYHIIILKPDNSMNILPIHPGSIVAGPGAVSHAFPPGHAFWKHWDAGEPRRCRCFVRCSEAFHSEQSSSILCLPDVS